MMRLSLSASADVIWLVIQIFEDSLWLTALVTLRDRLCNNEVLISLQLLAQCSYSMSLTTSIFSLDNNS